MEGNKNKTCNLTKKKLNNGISICLHTKKRKTKEKNLQKPP